MLPIIPADTADDQFRPTMRLDSNQARGTTHCSGASYRRGPRPRRSVFVLLAVIACACSAGWPQIDAHGGQQPTFRVESPLVLVDVIPEYAKGELRTRTPLTDLKQQDFRVFDEGREVQVRSLDVATLHSTRPIALWLIVQCPHGFPVSWGSDFLRGHVPLLRPALDRLRPEDAVGVAHWCDNGEAAIDLPPGRDPDAALQAVDHLLNQPVSPGMDRRGELAMQRMVRTIVNNVTRTKPDRLPVLLFLYGDHSATYPDEAGRIIRDVLETSGIVFGMGDGRSVFGDLAASGQISHLVHLYSRETGGEYYRPPNPEAFSATLDHILAQLHSRYTLSFKPLIFDGKRHKLKVEMTEDARKRYQGIRLRFRQAYIAVRRTSD